MKHLLMACSAALVLSACGDPLAGVERVSESGLDLPPSNTTLNTTRAIAATPQQNDTAGGGLFAGLFARNTSTQEDAQITTDQENMAAQTEDASGATTRLDTAGGVKAVGTGSAAATPRPRLFGGLFSADAEPDASLDLVSTPQVAPMGAPRAGLFGGLFASRGASSGTGPDARTVTPGTVLPFGEIARVCDVPLREMGKVVEQAGKGSARYTLHDSVPGSTAPRIFYVTGFSDGCARQFTAALAMFGDPGMHERLRYGLPSETYPYSTTDKAYERVKAAICSVPKRAPCGPRLSTLSRNTVFISTYERYTDNGRWADILLHDGFVLAASLKAL